MPEISIGLPVYNGETYLAGAVESALRQSFADFEVVILDNASTDGTGAIAESFAGRDPRVRYVRRPENVGAAANHNGCVGHARGRYFMWMSHDDLLDPAYLEKTRAVLDRRPDVVLCHSRTRLIDQTGEALTYRPEEDVYVDREGHRRVGGGRPGRAQQDEPYERFHDVLIRFIRCFDIYGLMRLDVLKRTQLHRPIYGQDKNLLAELALYGRFHEVPEELFLKREHPGQSLALARAEDRARWLDPTARASLFPHLGLQRLNAGAVLRAPLPLGQKVRCLRLVARNLGVRILIDPRNWRRTYLDQRTI